MADIHFIFSILILVHHKGNLVVLLREGVIADGLGVLVGYLVQAPAWAFYCALCWHFYGQLVHCLGSPGLRAWDNGVRWGILGNGVEGYGLVVLIWGLWLIISMGNQVGAEVIWHWLGLLHGDALQTHHIETSGWREDANGMLNYFLRPRSSIFL